MLTIQTQDIIKHSVNPLEFAQFNQKHISKFKN